MAHTRTISKSSRVVDQCARGRFIRNINSIPVIIAAARTNNTAPNRIMADVIDGETLYKPIFTAPSDLTINSIYASHINGGVLPSTASGRFIIADIYKSDKSAGTDVVINASATFVLVGSASAGASGLWYVAKTVGEAYDATILTNSNQGEITVGQTLYAKIALTSGDMGILASSPVYATINVEWTPNDTTYASS